MDPSAYFSLLFSDYTLRTISLGTVLMGIVCGVLGSFALLRRRSLLGDAVSHAALPGIVLAFMITGTKDPWLFFLGAILSGLAGAVWIIGISARTHLKTDTSLGLVLSVFFGLGILLLTMVQRQPNANQAGLDSFLFGQAATLMVSDVIMIAVVGLGSLILVAVFWKEFKLLSFDPQYAGTLGFKVRLLDILLTSLIVVAIVLGLQTVGVVLMSAMLLAPAAAARQWTNSLGTMVLLAGIFGALSGLTGTAFSTFSDKAATGPVIVLSATLLVVVSFFFSPGRGLLFKQIRLYRNRKSLRLHKTLSVMYEIASAHEEFSHPHSVSILNDFRGYSKKCLRELEARNLIVLKENTWMLTREGYEQAEMDHPENQGR
ncbi:MAG TPA: metal ABC transporter permease [Bacteroidales bacterium]|nr:metal ABC transporter permease [Bacteroidales bacterium]HSA44480.1 metal ABC transporter permease [Bacteroidales bacterium]